MSSSQDLTQSRNTSKTALLSNSMDMEEEQEKGDDELPAGISWKTVGLQSLSPLFSALSIGYAQGHSSVFLSSIGHHELLTVDQVSWIGSLLSLGLMVGTALGGSLSDLLSRRVCLLLTSPVIAAGWVAIAAGSVESLGMIYAGRFLTGLGTGCHIPVILTYMSNLVPKSHRGGITSLCPLFTCVGILLAYVVGLVLPWRLAAGAGAALAIAVAATFCLMAEDVDKEARTNVKETVVGDDKNVTQWKQLHRHLFVLRPMAVCTMLFLLQSFSGAAAISYYAYSIFAQLAAAVESSSGTDGLGGGVLEKVGVLLVGTAYVAGYLVSSAFLLERHSRKSLLVISALAMAASTAAVAAIATDGSGGGTDLIGWRRPMSLLALSAFVLAYSCGFGPIPYVYLGELFPPEFNGAATGTVSMMQCVFNFVTVKSFPYLLRWLGLGGAFLFSCCVCLLGAAFAVFAAPETRGVDKRDIWKRFGRPSDGGASNETTGVGVSTRP